MRKKVKSIQKGQTAVSFLVEGGGKSAANPTRWKRRITEKRRVGSISWGGEKEGSFTKLTRKVAMAECVSCRKREEKNRYL